MLKNTESTKGTNCCKNSMKNQKNEKQCKNVLKILQAVGYLKRIWPYIDGSLKKMTALKEGLY